ncbi:MAG: hypothetical protein JNL70_06965 [Saprospiraceae bacterium]|nr:hypothetical protein [Saprospiraceae bacterium]
MSAYDTIKPIENLESLETPTILGFKNTREPGVLKIHLSRVTGTLLTFIERRLFSVDIELSWEGCYHTADTVNEVKGFEIGMQYEFRVRTTGMGNSTSQWSEIFQFIVI